MIADRTRRQLHPVADDVVLIGEDRQRVLRFERLQPALRHRKRVMAELDLTRRLVALVHREVDDPAEAERVLLGEVEFSADAVAREAGELHRRRRHPGHEKYGVTVLETEIITHAGGDFGAEIARDRAGALAVAEEDIAEAGLSFRLRP